VFGKILGMGEWAPLNFTLSSPTPLRIPAGFHTPVACKLLIYMGGGCFSRVGDQSLSGICISRVNIGASDNAGLVSLSLSMFSPL